MAYLKHKILRELHPFFVGLLQLLQLCTEQQGEFTPQVLYLYIKHLLDFVLKIISMFRKEMPKCRIIAP
jgi:hypothetical protein